MRSLFVDRGAFVLSFTYDAVLSCALRGWPERHYDRVAAHGCCLPTATSRSGSARC